MATQRFNYGDKFKLNGKKVGISTSSPQENLDVASGTLKGVDLRSNSGITTFSTYEGFLNKKTTYTENVQIDTGVSGTLSGEIVVGSGLTMTVGTAATSGQGDVECLKVFNVFNPPCGGTANRPSAATPGTLYYNKDFKTIEYWDGNFWRQVDNTTRSGRAIFGATFNISELDFVNISTLGNAVYFGQSTLGNGGQGRAACSNSIRGLFGGGYSPGALHNEIDYITIASEGNAIDFGDLTTSLSNRSAFGNSTRGIWAGGANPNNVIEYVEIMTLGNALDFGDLVDDRQLPGATCSSTRGIIAGGSDPSLFFSQIDVVTISSTGNAKKFGDLTNKRGMSGGMSNGTRGVFASGYRPAYDVKTIDYVTIASGGQAENFGEMSINRGWVGATSSHIRGVIGGGLNPTALNIIDYIEIATTGNAMDFGDLTQARYACHACSDSHGGLGGF
tara:strand:+ start:1584 stop:2924 length:1341 start_codon:yes stop_codon:yes gene_type:complete